MSATTQAVLTSAVLVGISLVAAAIVLKVLQGTAVIRRRDVQLGGAAAMFVLTFVLLNKFLPNIRDGLINEAQAAAQNIRPSGPDRGQEPVVFAISPDTQATTVIDLRRLPRSAYVLEDELQIAVSRPPDATWEVGRFSGGIPSIDLGQIPFFKLAFNTVARMSGSAAAGEPKIFGVRSATRHAITITQRSTIDDVSVGLNPFEDSHYVENLIETQIEAGLEFTKAQIPEGQDIAAIKEGMKSMLQMGMDAQKQGYKKWLEKELPRKFEIRSGVYVLELTREMLQTEGKGFLAAFSMKQTLLDKSLHYLQMRNVSQFVSRNISVDQRKGIMSFDGTVALKDVQLGDSLRSLNVHHIGFVITGETRALFVNLVYVDAPGEGISTLLQLQKFLQSLRFTI